MTDIQFKAQEIALEWLRDHKSIPSMPISGIPAALTIESYVRIYMDAYAKALKELEKYSNQ